MSGSNHATRLKAKAFRCEFATLSQSSPLCLARFARSSQDIRMSERNKGAKQKPEAIASGFVWLPLLDLNQRPAD
jgi:hypothetical protein